MVSGSDKNDKKKDDEKNIQDVFRKMFEYYSGSKGFTALWNPWNWDYREFICGWGSAFINISVTYPINKVTFRQMLYNLTPLDAIKQVSDEGIHVLYRGILPPLCQKTTSLSLMFGVYEGTRVPLLEMVQPLTASILAALIAGTAEATLAPFERVQTLLQATRYQNEFTNTKHAFLTIKREHGYREFYRGLVPILLRNGPSNVCYFLMRDEAKARFHDRPSTWYGKLFTEFICGGLIGGFISTLFYPLNVIKVHLQSKLGGEFQNMFSAIGEIYNDRGKKISCFYRGVHLNYTRGFISWGVITVSSENLRKLLY